MSTGTDTPRWTEVVSKAVTMSRLSRMSHITPLPASVTREEAIAHLHDHQQMIRLNPMVLRHESTTAHESAAPDEAEQMVWYSITDEVQYIPGTPLKGEIVYKAGFYDLPNGIQTHTFAPGGVDIRGKWTVGGNAPGEKREEVEIGVDKPREGLYIHEEVDLKCHMLLSNFVKRNLKKSHATVVESIIHHATNKTGPPNPNALEHSRSEGDQPRPNPPSTSSSWASTPTSYQQRGPRRCSCPMASFGVHMESCHQPSNRRRSVSEGGEGNRAVDKHELVTQQHPALRPRAFTEQE